MNAFKSNIINLLQIFLEMETPKSSGKRIRAKKYAPTPKMSDRKKALFTTSSDQHKRTPTITTLSEIDDEDLGIMSPLQFSSSPTKYEDRGKFL